MLNEIFRNCHLLGDHNDITQIDSIEGQNSVFDRAYEKLIEICYNGQATPHKRPNDIQLNTFAKRLRQNELSWEILNNFNQTKLNCQFNEIKKITLVFN